MSSIPGVSTILVLETKDCELCWTEETADAWCLRQGSIHGLNSQSITHTWLGSIRLQNIASCWVRVEGVAKDPSWMQSFCCLKFDGHTSKLSVQKCGNSGLLQEFGLFFWSNERKDVWFAGKLVCICICMCVGLDFQLGLLQFIHVSMCWCTFVIVKPRWYIFGW